MAKFSVFVLSIGKQWIMPVQSSWSLVESPRDPPLLHKILGLCTALCHVPHPDLTYLTLSFLAFLRCDLYTWISSWWLVYRGTLFVLFVEVYCYWADWGLALCMLSLNLWLSATWGKFTFYNKSMLMVVILQADCKKGSTSISVHIWNLTLNMLWPTFWSDCLISVK